MKLIMKIIFIVGVLALENCASPASKEGMTLKGFDSIRKLNETIFVAESIGGSETNPFLISKVGNEDLSKALKDSIEGSKIFSGLKNSVDSGWLLKTEIIKQEQPYFSFATDCRLTIKYSLFKSNSLVKEFTIEKTGSASLKDSLRPVKRIQIVNENAAKANISSFLNELTKL